ncbi:DUF2202 domain-containing protein [Mesobacillus subterraneus]|uniref:ferritin-like domain-containing protein n=1 Tax=Mesobacillus subterraneus TaxID=285983 RepID=UPI00273D624D|nr:DUF2202 domain-containing protein [Mesobacillus subterraneus]WLR57432.1 DUF2202 domain-containing protein [Mesobacillus subterraneus]
MKLKLIQVAACFFFLISFSGAVQAQTELPADFGAKGALKDSSITFDEALIYAIQDEYLAQARYDAVIGKFGNIRPFNNIMAAEQQHISALVSLFQKYDKQIPEDNAKQYVSAPGTLKEAFNQGVQGEIDNIAMYDKLKTIPSLPEDAQMVFTQLGNASKNHLRAFQRGAVRN